MDEFFSGDPLHEQFYSFDSLPQPIVSEDAPLSPPESLPSPGVITNGQPDEPGKS